MLKISPGPPCVPGCLVSSDQEDFTYYENEYNEKMMFLYTREFRVPPQDPASRLEPWETLEISSQNALTVMTCM